jgi:hypothetical protein
MYSALGDNSAELVAVTFIAGILGARRLLRWMEDRRPSSYAPALLGIYVLVAALAAQVDDGFTPIGPRFSFPALGSHQRIERSFAGLIPAGEPVSTQDQLDPHLTDRHYLYLFEDTGGPPDPPTPHSDRILLDAAGPTYPLPSFEIHDRAMSYLGRPGWGVRAAQDGLILLQRGAYSPRIPRRFFSFLAGRPEDIEHRLKGAVDGLSIQGYSVTKTDMANHRVPSLQYTVFLRPTRPIAHDLQPVIFTRLGAATDCQGNVLGLDWLPTSKWHPGRLYAVRLQSIETFANSPGRKRFYLALEPAPTVERMLAAAPYSCTPLWKGNVRVWPLGFEDVTV